MGHVIHKFTKAQYDSSAKTSSEYYLIKDDYPGDLYNGTTKLSIVFLEFIGVTISQQPNKKTYAPTDVFDPTGMVVGANWGKNGVVAKSFTLDNYTYSTAPLQKTDTFVLVNCMFRGRLYELRVPITVLQTAIPVPTIKSQYSYSGSTITPEWNNYDSTKMTISGDTSGVNAGTYLVVFTLKSEKYKWNDGTDTPKTVTWNIAKKSITIPSITGTYTYNKTEQTATVSGFDSSKASQTGGKATEAGTYNITWSLLDKNNNAWSDGTTADVTKSWTIAVRKLTIPSAASSSFVYDGTVKTIGVNNFDSSYETKTGDTATNAGTHTVTFTLSDKTNTCWTDNTTSNKTSNWSIAAKQITIPAQSGTLTYNGSAQSPSWNSAYDSSKMSVSVTSQTNAGSYSATFTITDSNYTFSSGTTANATWSIGRASTAKVSVSPTSGSWEEIGSKVFTITNPSGGTLSSSSSSSRFTSTISGTSITVNAVSQTGNVETGTITITSAATTNYEASTCTISCSIAAKANVTLTVTGEGDTNYSYVQINGTKVISAGQYEVTPGTVITCGVHGNSSQNHGQVFVNGTRQLDVTSNTTSTYNYTVNDNTCVFLAYESNNNNCGQILVSTVTGNGNVIPTIFIDTTHNNYVTLFYAIDSDGKIWACGTGRGGGTLASLTSYTPSQVSDLSIGTHNVSITASWSGDSQTKAVSYTVESNSPLASIAVTGTPIQLNVGDAIDPTGLTVNATLLDGSVFTVTDEVTWSAPSAYYSGGKWTQAGSSTIAATYVRKGVSKTSANVNVTIIEAPSVVFATATKNGGNSATISFTVAGQPTAFMIGATANITVGSSTSKQITSVSGNGSGTNKANFVVYASNARLVGLQTTNITTSYSNGSFTVTVTGCVFSSNIGYKLEYAYGGTPTISMGNATVTTTLATYSGLTLQPEVVMMQVMPTSNQSISTTGRLQYVIFHKDATYGYGMYSIQSGSSWSASYTATYIANSYTCTYSNGTITIKPGSQQLFASNVSTEAVMCWMGNDSPGPGPTTNIPVTITGVTGSTSNMYAKINGVTLVAPGSYTSPVGQAIEIGFGGGSAWGATTLTINGTTVGSYTDSTLHTYSYTPASSASSVTINFAYGSAYGSTPALVTMTESSSPGPTPTEDFVYVNAEGSGTASISFTISLTTKPTVYAIGAMENLSGSSKMIAEVFSDGTNSKATFILATNFNGLTTGISTSISGTTFTVTVSGCVFLSGVTYKLAYPTGTPTVVTKSGTASSGQNNISFTGLTEEPDVFVLNCQCTSNNSFTDTGYYRHLYVLFIKGEDHGYGILTGSSNAIYDDSTVYTYTYTNGTLKITANNYSGKTVYMHQGSGVTQELMCINGGGTPGPTPTEDYTYLEYIQSNGTDAYLNTGVIVNNDNLNWSIDYSLVTAATTATTNASIMGAYISNGVNGLMRYDLWFTLKSYGVMHKNSLLAISALDSGRHTVTTTGTTTKTVTVDGTSAGTVSGTRNFATYAFYVAAANGNGTADLFVAAKYYEITFTNGSTTTAHLLPCKENATNKIGMYDTVANKFIAGNGTWVAGPEA